MALKREVSPTMAFKNEMNEKNKKTWKCDKGIVRKSRVKKNEKIVEKNTNETGKRVEVDDVRTIERTYLGKRTHTTNENRYRS